MKIAVEVEVPKRLVIDTEVLVEELGANRVLYLFKRGLAEAGQKAYRKNGSSREEAERAGMEPRELTAEEEAELEALNADMERGL